MRTLCLICLAALAGACTPHSVRCDGRLEPINAPAGPAADGTTPSAAAGRAQVAP